MRCIILILLTVFLQATKAQSIILLASQSNCANGFYVDYIATATKNEQKSSLILQGQIFTNYDSITSISFVTEKGFYLQNNKREKTKVIFNKVRLGNLFQQLQSTKDTSVKLPVKFAINSKNLYLDFTVLNCVFKKGIEFELLCCIEFKNGCKYLKRQKIIL